MTGALILGMVLVVLREPGSVRAGNDVGFQMQVGGREATITYTAAEPMVFSWQLKLNSGAVVRESRRSGPGDIPESGIPTSGGGPAERGGGPSYVTRLSLYFEPLQSNTVYRLELNGTTRSGQRVFAVQAFGTHKQRVRITLDEITVERDGDRIGKGEILWMARIRYPGGFFIGCYPNTDAGSGGYCVYRDYSEGSFSPRSAGNQRLTTTFAEENFDAMPDRFILEAIVEESDFPHPCLPCNYYPPEPTFEWLIPARGETAFTVAQIRADDDGAETVLTFRLTMFHDSTPIPSRRRNAPATTWGNPFGEFGEFDGELKREGLTR